MQLFISKSPAAARIFLGLLFTVFGLNGFFAFMPTPEPTAEGGAFLGALAATGYMFPLIKGTEVVAGLLLLSNRFVPLALTVLTPVTVNILAYHTVLAPGMGFPLFIVGVQLFLAYRYRDAFKPMLRSRTEVRAGGKPSSAGVQSSLQPQGV